MIRPGGTAITFSLMGAVAVLSTLLTTPIRADEACKLGLGAQLPIAMSGTRPMFTAKEGITVA